MRIANHLFFGDNLDVLRTHVPDESVDLIYLDPPFNSNASYVILFYAKSKGQIFHMPKTAWTRDDLERSRKQKIHVDDDGVEWIWMPGGKGKSKSKMRRVDEIIQGGKAISDVWQIPIISSSSRERLGYPTQKPLALLERIIAASSNEGDVVLDPFCGCGTAVHAAQKLGRRWVGIDITHLAVGLIEKRMNEAFPGVACEVVGRPQSLAAARDLARRDKHQFELWALSVVDADPWKGGRKGPDGGIDGIIWFKPDGKKTEKAIVEVKGGGSGVKDVGRLAQVMEREKAKIGILLAAQAPTRAMARDAAAVGRLAERLYRPQSCPASNHHAGRAVPEQAARHSVGGYNDRQKSQARGNRHPRCAVMTDLMERGDTRNGR